ncbi:MAG TPA: hypothetical protein VHK06_05190 [Candidatus Limnocylindria bacterium]|nr:hypothetical protein [Candidatus Limnocylindria bacterium]
MAELRIAGAEGRRRLEIRLPGAGRARGLETDAIALVLLADRPEVVIPIAHAELVGTSLVLTGESERFAATAVWRRAADGAWHDVDLTVTHRSAMPVLGAVRVPLHLAGAGAPTWLIPGCFYGENRLAACRRRFPRWDPAARDRDVAEMTSDSWAFRSDRASLAAVCVRDAAAFGGMATDEATPLGLSGIGFRGSSSGAPAIWIDVPYREEPVTHAGPERAAAPDRRWYAWEPGEPMRIRYSVAAEPAGPFAFVPFLRGMAARRRASNPLRPWLRPAEAAGLAAEGLHRWHYAVDPGVLWETVAFDRELAGIDGQRIDRRSMHVAWVSGAPWAAALLRAGRLRRNAAWAEAAARVLDTIASGVSPSGVFWGEWRDGRWVGGWNPDGMVHARTVSEATLFMLRALREEAAAGTSHPEWERAVRSNLEFAVSRQDADGNPGSYYEPHEGRVADRTGAAGLPWVAALAEASALFGAPHLLDAARRAGADYARFVEDALVYGAPEDVHLAPTSEDGYNAVLAYTALAELDRHDDGRWTELARRAADWMLTFRMAYNVAFPKETLLGAYDYRTRGADLASPANQHLHGYGLICVPEMLRLARRVGDAEYTTRTQDSLAAGLQFVARRDGDFNAYRGMVGERYYQTDWAQAKGMLLSLSHAWSVGAVLHASLHALEDPDAVPA